MIAIPLTCSLAFVLPVGTPPNSLVYAHQHYSTADMAKPGIVIKIVSTVLMLSCVAAIGVPMFNLLEPNPPWLDGYMISNATKC